MTTSFGLWSTFHSTFISYGGRVLVHPDRAELEWLFPGASVRPVPAGISPEESMAVADHPDLVGVVSWPLKKEEFR